MQGLVIHAFAASGKTTLGKKYKNCLDLQSSPYHYILTDNQQKVEHEKRKGQKLDTNPDWPQNYFNAIDKAIQEYDFVLINHAGIEHCKNKNYKYMRVFPSPNQKEIYTQRMKKRGNSQMFINHITEIFEKQIEESKQDKQAIKVELQNDEYLEDCLKRLNLL